MASWEDRDARIAQYLGIVIMAWRLSKAFVASVHLPMVPCSGG